LLHVGFFRGFVGQRGFGEAEGQGAVLDAHEEDARAI
jgi:hypothetical protein